jgi:hypothetical protein
VATALWSLRVFLIEKGAGRLLDEAVGLDMDP